MKVKVSLIDGSERLVECRAISYGDVWLRIDRRIAREDLVETAWTYIPTRSILMVEETW